MTDPGPLDAVDQARARQIRGAYEGTTGSVGVIEEVRFRVKTAAAHLVALRQGSWPHGHQASQGGRLGHVHVIAGQEPDARAAQRCRAQVTFQDVETAFHHEGDGEARCGAMPQLVAQGVDQGGARARRGGGTRRDG